MDRLDVYEDEEEEDLGGGARFLYTLLHVGVGIIFAIFVYSSWLNWDEMLNQGLLQPGDRIPTNVSFQYKPILPNNPSPSVQTINASTELANDTVIIYAFARPNLLDEERIDRCLHSKKLFSKSTGSTWAFENSIFIFPDNVHPMHKEIVERRLDHKKFRYWSDPSKRFLSKLSTYFAARRNPSVYKLVSIEGNLIHHKPLYHNYRVTAWDFKNLLGLHKQLKGEKNRAWVKELIRGHLNWIFRDEFWGELVRQGIFEEGELEDWRGVEGVGGFMEEEEADDLF